MNPTQIYAEAGVEITIIRQDADGVIIAEAGGVRFPTHIRELAAEKIETDYAKIIDPVKGKGKKVKNITQQTKQLFI